MWQIFGENNWLVLLLALWTLPWKGVALWKAANAKHKVWFIVLLVINSVGILEILYIFVFSRLIAKKAGLQPTQLQPLTTEIK